MDFFAWNLILDYLLQPSSTAVQRELSMAQRGVGGHLQKGKPVNNSLANILGICLIQSGLTGQLKKYTGSI